MSADRRRAILDCWNNATRDEKKKIMSRCIVDHCDDFSIERWLEFISREFGIEELEDYRITC